MFSIRLTKILSQMLVLASFITCCVLPLPGSWPGVAIPLVLINIISDDGKVTLSDPSSYYSTLLCFLLPLIFSFFIWIAKYKTTRIVSIFLLLPLLLGVPMINISIVYIIFSIVQIALWWTTKEEKTIQ